MSTLSTPIEQEAPPLLDDESDTDEFFRSIPRHHDRTKGKGKPVPTGPEGHAANLAKRQAEKAATDAQNKLGTDVSLAKLRTRHFKISHGFLVAFFLWVAYTHIIGIYLFTRGFLLTRTALDAQSTCETPPLDDLTYKGSKELGCWHPTTFHKAVIIIIDALRYDFTVPYNGTSPSHYHNAFTAPYELALAQPENAFLLPFIADPPTTTLQRLKGLTTGTLPTFVDAGSNFAGTAIEEDNLIAQLKRRGDKLAFLGDDTWTALFPNYFDIEHAYESLNVWDLHTVDEGVTEHLFPLLTENKTQSWDVMIGHFLGVDHAGHRYGPDHPAMNAKLKQMDGMIRKLVEEIDDYTLLVMMGDHGMDPKGDHGGESDLELEAGLFMYSKLGVFGRHPEALTPPMNAKGRTVGQIDLVPTLALLLGLPIPFNNLGAPIEEAFIGPDSDSYENLAEVLRVTDAQIERYQKEYASARNEEIDIQDVAHGHLAKAEENWRTVHAGEAKKEDWKTAYDEFRRYQQENLDKCKKLWANFDLLSMSLGISILVGSIAVLLVYSRGLAGDSSDFTGMLFARIIILGFVFAGASYGASQLSLAEVSPLNLALFGSAMGSVLGFFVGVLNVRSRLTSLLPTSIFGFMSLLFVVLQFVMFAANSFAIWEDRILTFFLSTFAFFAIISSQRQAEAVARALGTYHSVVFLCLTRLASLSRLCREEQMPYCESTFYASATSSVSSPYSLGVLFLIALVFPSIIRSFYVGTKSYEGPAVLFIGFSLRLGLALVALYWSLDSADNGEWLNIPSASLKMSKMMVAQVVLGLALVAGNIGFAWCKLCLNVEIIDSSPPEPAAFPTLPEASTKPAKPAPTGNRSMILLGYANLHGSRYFLLVLVYYLCLALLQKPMGGLSLAILVYQLVTLLEIIDTNSLSLSPIGPIVCALLGSSHFFSTGHQATLSSIQWESAFIPLSTITYPWSPLLVMGNTFAAQILCAIAVPAIVLWKREVKRPGVLGDVSKAAGTYVLYFLVIGTGTVMWAGWLRRHLMLYRVFMPRFLVGGVVLVVVDLAVVLGGIVGVGWNSLAVGEVFGVA